MSRYLQVPVTGVQDIGYKVPLEWWDAELQRKNKAAEETAAGMDVVNATTFQYLDKDKEAAQAQLSSWKQKEEELANLYMQDPEKAAIELAKTKRQLTRELSTPGELAYEAQSRYAALQAKQKQVDALKDKMPIEQWYNIDRELKNLDPLKQGEDGKWSGNSFSGLVDIPDIGEKVMSYLKEMDADMYEYVTYDTNPMTGLPELRVTNNVKGITQEKVDKAVKGILNMPEIQPYLGYQLEFENKDFTPGQSSKYLESRIGDLTSLETDYNKAIKKAKSKEQKFNLQQELQNIQTRKQTILDNPEKAFQQERYEDLINRYSTAGQKIKSYQQLSTETDQLYVDREGLKQQSSDFSTMYTTAQGKAFNTKNYDELKSNFDKLKESVKTSQSTLDNTKISFAKQFGLVKEGEELPEGIVNQTADLLENIKKTFNNYTGNDLKGAVNNYLIQSGARPFSDVEQENLNDGLTWEQFTRKFKEYDKLSTSTNYQAAQEKNHQSIISSLRDKTNTGSTPEYWYEMRNNYKSDLGFYGQLFGLDTKEKYAQFMMEHKTLTKQDLLELNKKLSAENPEIEDLEISLSQTGDQAQLANQARMKAINSLIHAVDKANKDAYNKLPSNENEINIKVATNHVDGTLVNEYDQAMKNAASHTAAVANNLTTPDGTAMEKALENLGLEGEEDIKFSTLKYSPAIIPSGPDMSFMVAFEDKNGTANSVEITATTDPEFTEMLTNFALKIANPTDGPLTIFQESDPRYKNQVNGLQMLGHKYFAPVLFGAEFFSGGPGKEVETDLNGNSIQVKQHEDGYYGIKINGTSIYDVDDKTGLQQTNNLSELYKQLGEISYKALYQ